MIELVSLLAILKEKGLNKEHEPCFASRQVLLNSKYYIYIYSYTLLIYWVLNMHRYTYEWFSKSIHILFRLYHNSPSKMCGDVRCRVCEWFFCCTLRILTLQWRHDERDGVSNHQPRDCLFNHSFRRISMHWPLWGEFTGERWLHRTNGQ